MRESFAEAARTVIQIANREAMRYGRDHIGTEHLLLGLAEDQGVAGQVLRATGADASSIRDEIEKLVQSRAPTESSLQSPRLAGVVGYAMEEARRLYHTSVGADHLLLGLLLDPGCRASEILGRLGLLDRVRADLLSRLPPGSALEIANRRALEQRFEKHPQVQELKRRIEDAQVKLENAVAAADFQTAASYRDRREAIEQSLEDLYTALGREPDALLE